MIRSGLSGQLAVLLTSTPAYRNVPRPAIPIPALDVPYAAPTVEKTIFMSATVAGFQIAAAHCTGYSGESGVSVGYPELGRRIAHPKKGAQGGHSSDIMLSMFSVLEQLDQRCYLWCPFVMSTKGTRSR